MIKIIHSYKKSKDTASLCYLGKQFTNEFLLISRYFGIGSVTSHFLLLKFSLLDVKMRKKKERQTFRPHMRALFSAINS